MRVEPYTVGSYMHVIKRGGRGAPIVKDQSDKYRFVRSLFYLNDTFFDENWDRAHFTREARTYNSQTIVSTASGKDVLFYRPPEWPEREPLVKILCYTLMPNHFHLLLKEVREGGVTIFMKKLGQSMTNHFNEKYSSKGSIFQGSYKSKTVDEDVYLRYVAAYIMVKNVFELYPAGITAAAERFEDSWKFAISYPFSSLPDYVAERRSPIIDADILGSIFSNRTEFKKFARDMIMGRKWESDRHSEFHRASLE